MIEQVFVAQACGTTAGEFVYSALLDELRCHTSEWLLEYRAEAVAEQRRAYVRELAATAVLDERGCVDDSFAGADGVSVRSVRETVETARRLQELPEMAAAAYAGTVSPQQLTPAAKLADPSTDRAWTRRAQNTSPQDLAAQVHKAKAPTGQEWAARRARRSLRWWWNDDHTMLSLHGDLPDLQGVAFERVLDQLVERIRPAKGQDRDTREHRGADALVDLCLDYADVHVSEMPEPLFVLHHTPGEPVTIAGIPLPDSLVEALLANAKVEVVVADVHGAPVSLGPARPVLAKRIRRAILRRDATCRYLGCDRRRGLQVHHLTPKSWGGTDDLSNLVTVCAQHHVQLAPHGDRLLVGNPNRPDGLRLIRVDQLAQFIGQHQARAGPHTA